MYLMCVCIDMRVNNKCVTAANLILKMFDIEYLRKNKILGPCTVLH